MGVMAIVCLGSVGMTQADLIQLAPSKDNTLFEESDGLLSNGAGQRLFVGRTNQLEGLALRRGLIAFDVGGSIPAGSVINGASLTMRLSRTRFTTARVVNLHRASADWGEGTSDAGGQEGAGAPATPGDATWIHTFSSSDFWTTAGGDFAPTESAGQSVGGLNSYTWGSTAQMVADVQMWLDTPAGNFGWVIIGDESVTLTAKRFDSRENLTESNRPVLAVDFTPPVLVGDFDGNGRVDLDDYKTFADCIDGPALDCAGDCCDADFDESGTVDHADTPVFFRNFTGL